MLINNLHWRNKVKYIYLLTFMTFAYLIALLIGEKIQIANYEKERAVYLNRTEPYVTIVEDSINLTIASIERRLKGYQFEDSGIQNILEPFKAGYPVRTIIASVTGSGSSYLREVYDFGMPTFYATERAPRAREKHRDVLYDIRNILTCDLAKSRQFNEQLRYGTGHFAINPIQSVCRERRKLCQNAQFASTLCRLYPFRVAKVLRLPVRKLKALMNDRSLYVRLLLMVRDPRAIVASRHRLIVCMKNPQQCNDATTLCRRMLEDYRYARFLSWKYPQRVSFMRYEDLIEDMANTMVELFHWYGVELPNKKRKLAFMAMNPGSTIDQSMLSTIRLAQKPFQWKEEIDHEVVANIESVCENVMGAYGYRVTASSSDLLNSSWRPVEDYISNPDKFDTFIMSKEAS